MSRCWNKHCLAEVYLVSESFENFDFRHLKPNQNYLSVQARHHRTHLNSDLGLRLVILVAHHHVIFVAHHFGENQVDQAIDFQDCRIYVQSLVGTKRSIEGIDFNYFEFTFIRKKWVQLWHIFNRSLNFWPNSLSAVAIKMKKIPHSSHDSSSWLSRNARRL